MTVRERCGLAARLTRPASRRTTWPASAASAPVFSRRVVSPGPRRRAGAGGAQRLRQVEPASHPRRLCSGRPEARSSGTARPVGEDWARPSQPRLHYVGHLDAVKPTLTVAENLDGWAAFQGRGAGRRRTRWRRSASRTSPRCPRAFSRPGQRRRLALARRRWQRSAPLWLLDEPTVTLDAARRRPRRRHDRRTPRPPAAWRWWPRMARSRLPTPGAWTSASMRLTADALLAGDDAAPQLRAGARRVVGVFFRLVEARAHARSAGRHRHPDGGGLLRHRRDALPPRRRARARPAQPGSRPAPIWVAALLAALLSLDRLFVADHEDGSLEQLMLGVLPLEFVVLAKTVAHWLTTGLPLAAAAPIAGDPAEHERGRPRDPDRLAPAGHADS